MGMEAISLKGRQDESANNPKLARLADSYARAVRPCHGEHHEPSAWPSTAKELSDTRQEMQRLANELLTVQEDERKRIAADLHDGIGQSLSLLKLSAKVAIEQLESGSPEVAARTLAGLDAKVHEVLSELRRVCLDLRPSMLDDLGILPTLSWLLRDVEEAGSGLAISKVVTVEESEIPEKLKITVFRIVQEAMCNIAKHADASNVRVVFLRTEDGLRLNIEDNGRGFDSSDIADRSHTGRGLGVRGMMERARLSGGQYRLDSTPGAGTRVQVFWPLESVRDDWADVPLVV